MSNVDGSFVSVHDISLGEPRVIVLKFKLYWGDCDAIVSWQYCPSRFPSTIALHKWIYGFRVYGLP